MISSLAMPWLLSVLGSHTQWSQGLPGRLLKLFGKEGNGMGTGIQRELRRGRAESDENRGKDYLNLHIWPLGAWITNKKDTCYRLIQNTVHCKGRFMECSQLHACGFILQLLILKSDIHNFRIFFQWGEVAGHFVVVQLSLHFKIANIPTFFPFFPLSFPYLFWMQPILPVMNLHSLSLRLPALCGRFISWSPSVHAQRKAGMAVR